MSPVPNCRDGFTSMRSAMDASRPTPSGQAARSTPEEKPRRGGFAPGTARKRFTEPQRQSLIDLIHSHPHSPSTVKEKFAEAWPGLTVAGVYVHQIKRKPSRRANSNCKFQ
jgi:hypothetical protein